jgi:dienelactone hydrolase
VPGVTPDEPALSVVTPAHTPATALALVLHGGRSRSHARTRAGQLAVARMRPFATSLRSAGASHGLAVARLRYLVRGWNDEERSPVHDVAWALGQLANRFPDIPFGLVGHSMGGRAAVYSAGHASVRTVVGLAPWIEPGDPVAPLAGRDLLVAHGDHDRMTSAPQSAHFTDAARAVAERASYVAVRGDRHAMLRRAPIWHALATGYVLATLCDVSPEETAQPDVANVLMKVLAGEQSVVV